MGKPARKRSVARDTGQAKPSRASIAQPSKRPHVRGLSEAIDADASRVVSIFNEAETGRVARLIDLYKGTRIVDSRLNSVCNARILGIVGRPIVWKCPAGFENDATAKDNAEKLTRLWNSQKHTAKTIGHLAHGALEGHAFGELLYFDDVDTGWVSARIAPVRANRLRWNAYERPEFLQDPYGTAGIPLDDAPDKWIFHAPGAGASDYPWRLGAMRSRVIPSTIKRFTARAWISLLERWGQPQVAAFVEGDGARNDSDERIEDLVVDALRALGTDWRAAFPKGVELKEIAVNVSDALHKTFIEAQNIEDAIAILGQNLTTEVSGGSFAAAAAHRHVRYDILAADCMELAETLTDQWAEPIIRYNRPGTPVPYAEFVLTPKRELTTVEYQLGLFDRDTVALSMGHEAEADGKGRRFFQGAMLAGTPASAETSSPSNSGPGASAVDTGPGVIGLPAAPTKPATEEPDVEPEATAEPLDIAQASKAADTALTGIQGERLEAIVLNVKNGVYPPSVGKLLIKGTFPGLDMAFVDELMSAVSDAGIAPPTLVATPENPSAALPVE